ncbi:MAG: hypothetical protein QG657_3385, partial [Acidobacteriota bacterium]|nr:hypothetical protein [Acidobacteriota bacterium]
MKKKNRYSVLLVDDDAKLLASLSPILEENGYRVLTGANGHEA